jgi:hypothetical protein
MEQCVDIDVVAIVTDRCRKIGLDSRRFKMNTKTELVKKTKVSNKITDIKLKQNEMIEKKKT